MTVQGPVKEQQPDGMSQGGGGVYGGGICVSQLLCEMVVRNLFGVFKDLHGCAVDCAFAHLYRAGGCGE